MVVRRCLGPTKLSPPSLAVALPSRTAMSAIFYSCPRGQVVVAARALVTGSDTQKMHGGLSQDGSQDEIRSRADKGATELTPGASPDSEELDCPPT
jgi:hypothetical protein